MHLEYRLIYGVWCIVRRTICVAFYPCTTFVFPQSGNVEHGQRVIEGSIGKSLLAHFPTGGP